MPGSGIHIDRAGAASSTTNRFTLSGRRVSDCIGGQASARTDWWEQPWLLISLVLISAIPLLGPETPPLVDLPGHMARYRVQLDLPHSATLQRYFEFHWALIGNLGVDLLVIPLTKILDLEFAVKLIVIAIPMLTVVGMLWTASEIHRTIPPTAIFAIPFAYSHPFNYGFVNFSLSVAFALTAFAFWLYLARKQRWRTRILLFIPICCGLWAAHALGWAIFCALAGSSEILAALKRKSGFRDAFASIAPAMIPLTLPILLMVAWWSGPVESMTVGFLDGSIKIFSILTVLRDRWFAWDLLGLGVALLVIAAGTFERRLRVAPELAVPAASLVLLFLAMPAMALGSALADVRLTPLIFITFILSIGVRRSEPKADGLIAAMAIGFAVLRLAGNTTSFLIADKEARNTLAALEKMPHGTRVLSLVGQNCPEQWQLPRHLLLNSFVTTRLNGFVNSHWQAAGAQLLRVKYEDAARFTDGASSAVFQDECVRTLEKIEGVENAQLHRVDYSLAHLPRDAFDFVWLIRPPDWKYREEKQLRLVWQNENSVLLKVERDGPD